MKNLVLFFFNKEFTTIGRLRFVLKPIEDLVTMGRRRFVLKPTKARHAGKGKHALSGKVLAEHQTELALEEEELARETAEQEKEMEEYRWNHYAKEGCSCMFLGFKGMCVLEIRERWLSGMYRY